MAPDEDKMARGVEPTGTDLHGTKVAIVGGTGGLGRALARSFAARGASVLVVGRTFRDAGVPGITFLQADLELMREAERVAAELPAEMLDLVVFTTGIFAAPTRQETAEGLERDMAVSYLNRLVILRAIAPRLGTQRPTARGKPRVFVMGYPGNGQAGTLDDLNSERSYGAMSAHMNTVAGNEALVLHAAKRWPHATFVGLNPGIVRTDIRSNLLGAGTLRFRLVEGLIGLLRPSADAFARRLTPFLVAQDLEGRSGTMLDAKGRPIPASPALTAAYVDAFVQASEALVARAGVVAAP